MLYDVFVLLWMASVALCETRMYDFNVSYTTRAISPHLERQVIVINDAWPLPIIEASKGDRLVVNVTNHIDEDISIHFHGIFQRGSAEMDGTMMVSQCGIPPGGHFVYNFTVDQVGTYWYHSHSAGQYADGLRGVMIVRDPEPPFHYDQAVPLSIGDWYLETSQEAITTERFLRGGEPRIQDYLFNETIGVQWDVQPNTTYYLQIVNMGMSLSQYLYLEDHDMTIVEIDGVYVEPTVVDSVYIVSGQRYGVLVKTKQTTDQNYRFGQVVHSMMSSNVKENWIVYNSSLELSSSFPLKTKNELNLIDDIDLVPLERIPVYEHVDKQFYLEFSMENGHYSFNHKPYELPKVPTLFSVMNTTDDYALDNYAASSNPYIIEKGEVVEIIVDSSHDMMRHPFHLHGHNFQVLYHGKDLQEMKIPEFPMRRDTVNLKGYSKVVLRFKADNPGVWVFHCHIDWHLIQGLGITIIEDPGWLRENLRLPQFQFAACVEGVSVPQSGSGDETKVDAKPQENETAANSPSTVKWPLFALVAIIVLSIVVVSGYFIYARLKKSVSYQQLGSKDVDIELNQL